MALKFTLKKKVETKPAYRFLTQEEIKTGAAELSGKIVKMVLDDVTSRFEPKAEEMPITTADAYQVAVMAVSVATSILMLDSTKTGLPLDKILNLHTTILRSAMQQHQENQQ